MVEILAVTLNPALDDEQILKTIVSRLVESINPERIILFGSRALATPSSSSDFDLMIVEASSQPHHRRLKPAYDALWGIPAPIDLLWYTPEEVERLSRIPTHIAARATLEGKLLYERSAA